MGFLQPVKPTEAAECRKGVPAGAGRTINGLEVWRVSPEFISTQLVYTERELNTHPGNSFSFIIDRKADIYIAVDAKQTKNPKDG